MKKEGRGGKGGGGGGGGAALCLHIDSKRQELRTQEWRAEQTVDPEREGFDASKLVQAGFLKQKRNCYPPTYGFNPKRGDLQTRIHSIFFFGRKRVREAAFSRKRKSFALEWKTLLISALCYNYKYDVVG